jgi:hypothetical protein
VYKKRKLNVSVNDYTYPSPSKAIQQNKIELNNEFNLEMMQENISKTSCNKNLVTNNNDVSNDTTNISSDNITMKTISQKENTKEKLGVKGLIAMMKPATESQSPRAYKQPLRSHPSNKIKNYWTQSPMETFISYQKEKTNPFPT